MVVTNKRTRILFVGGFSVGKDGTEGGQAFACRSLVASPISEHVTWKLVDSTQRSLPPPGMLIRTWDAGWRLLQCLYHLIVSRVRTVLVFTNFSVPSLAEKGLICMLGRLFGKYVVVSFRFHPHLPKRGQGLYRWYLKHVCRACHKIMCQSQLAADALRRLVPCPVEKIEIVHNWIDVRRFSRSRTELTVKEGENTESGPIVPSAPSSKRPGDGNVVQMIYVGWMHPKKGVQFLIPAIRLLRERRQDFRLVMCGAGDLLESLQSEADRLGVRPWIDFRGWVKNEEVDALLQQSDFFVLPSLAEGMPNSLLQAMACGLPVVTTNVSSIPAIVTDGVNGFLIEPGDPQVLCDALDRMIASPELRQQMAMVNRTQIAEHDIANVWPRVARILRVEGTVA